MQLVKVPVMCLSPNTLKDRTIVACRGCRVCKDNRLNDLIGRCVAEQQTADETLSVTLTYGGGDTAESVVLYYKHVQLMLAHMRADGLKVRYICAGEYGSAKGRAHWHIVLFLYGTKLNQPLETRVNWKYWPHGHCYFQRPDYRGFRYVMKYALKQENGVKSLSMSKKPPLGFQFFMDMARDIVDRGLPIHSPAYSFMHVVDKDNKPREYWLQGRMREMFLERYCSEWRDKYNSEPPYSDFLVEKYLDPIARKEMELDPERYERDRDYREARYLTQQIAARSADFQQSMTVRHAIAYTPIEFAKSSLLVVYSDRTAELFLEKDGPPCLLSASVSVVAQLRASGLKPSLLKPVLAYLTEKWQLATSSPA